MLFLLNRYGCCQCVDEGHSYEFYTCHVAHCDVSKYKTGYEVNLNIGYCFEMKEMSFHVYKIFL